MSIRKFLFATDAERFIRIFSKVVILYSVLRILKYHWHIYSTLAPYVYHPPGLFFLPFPSLILIHILTGLALAAAALAYQRILYRPAMLTLFFINLLFDGWHNGFGFIEVQIHYIWFLGILALCPLGRKSKPDKELFSFAFRWMELIVVLAYAQSGIAKLMISGFSWAADGTTLQIGLLRQGLVAGEWLANWPTAVHALAWSTLIFEVSFLLYYLIPKYRWVLLTVAISFHLGTWIFMGIDFSHLWIFSATTLIVAPQLLGFKVSRVSTH